MCRVLGFLLFAGRGPGRPRMPGASLARCDTTADRAWALWPMSSEAHVPWSGAAPGEATVVRSPAARATGEKSGSSKGRPGTAKNKQCEAQSFSRDLCDFNIPSFRKQGLSSTKWKVPYLRDLFWDFPHLPNLLAAFSICFWGSDSKSAVDVKGKLFGHKIM